MVSGSCVVQRLQAALRHRERVVGEVDLPGLLVQLVHREVDDPAEAEGVLLDQAELLAEARAHRRRRTSRAACLLVADEEHGVAVRRGRAAARIAASRVGVEVLGDRPLGAPSASNDDVAEARPPLARAPSRSACRRSCAAASAAPGAGMARTTPPLLDAPANRPKPEPREGLGDVGDHASGCAGPACRCRIAASPRRRRCAGTAAASPRGRRRTPRTRRAITGSIAANTSSCVDEAHLEVELVELARASGRRGASSSRKQGAIWK